MDGYATLPSIEDRVTAAPTSTASMTRPALLRFVAQNRRLLRGSLLLVGATACATPARIDLEDEPPIATAEAGGFVLKQGETTVASERYLRTDHELDVDMALPNAIRATYTAQLRSDASVARVDVRQYAPGAGASDPPMMTSSGVFQGDTVVLSRTMRDSTETARRATVRGVIPYINPSPSAMEQIVRRAKAIGGSRTEVSIWIPSAGGQNATAIVEWTEPGSAELTVSGTRILLRVDAQGRILGGSIPAQGLTLVRTAFTPR